MVVGKGYENGDEANKIVNSLVQPPCKMDQSVSCKSDIGTSLHWFDFRDGDSRTRIGQSRPGRQTIGQMPERKRFSKRGSSRPETGLISPEGLSDSTAAIRRNLFTRMRHEG